MARALLKKVFLFILRIVMLPIFLFYRVKIFSFTTLSQAFSLIPGLLGVAVRRVWYEKNLEGCGENLIVDFLSAIRTSKSIIGNNCYIGRANWFGWVEIGDDFLSGNGVTINSGNEQHGWQNLDQPIRMQPGKHRMVKIGEDVWIGSNTSVLEDISRGTVVGSGSVVTKTFPEYSVIAGVPAKVIRMRNE
jgi:acetyltransferase-like isoleucine patch superfamily enzyme